MPLRHPGVDSVRPLVFAHRGGALLAPENTMTAFENAVDVGVDGIELDVQLSRDGTVVVHHDATLTRTAAVDAPVAALTADELARVDAAFHFQPERRYPLRGRGVGVPRLSDVLARCPATRVIVELKASSPSLGRAVVDVVRAADAVDRVCVGGYSVRALRAVRAYEPCLSTSASRQEVRWGLYRSWVSWPTRRARYRAFQVPEVAGRTRVVSPRFVRYAHAAGLPVQVWTVDAVEDIRRLLDWGVDAIISDRPDVALETVHGWARANGLDARG